MSRPTIVIIALPAAREPVKQERQPMVIEGFGADTLGGTGGTTDPAPIRALAATEWESLSYADEDDPPATVKYFVMLAAGGPAPPAGAQ